MTVKEAIQIAIIEKLKALIVENDMVATGDLLNSIEVIETPIDGGTRYDIKALDYIVGLEEGIEPKSTPYPEIDDLITWINAKGLDLNPYAVRNGIIKNGTSWYQVGGSHIIEKTINDEAFAEVANLSKSEYQNQIKNQWQSLFKKDR